MASPLPDPSEGSGWKLKGSKNSQSYPPLRSGRERSQGVRLTGRTVRGGGGSWWCQAPRSQERGLPRLQLSVEVAGMSQSLLPMWGPRGSLEDPALRGPLGLPWGHGWSFSAQSWGGGQLITLVPVPVASPRPPLPPALCQPRVVCPRGTAPQGSASLLRVPQEAGSRDQRTLSLCESPKPQPPEVS